MSQRGSLEHFLAYGGLWLLEPLCGGTLDGKAIGTVRRDDVTCERCLLFITIADANHIALSAMRVRQNIENVMRAAQANGQGEPAGT